MMADPAVLTLLRMERFASLLEQGCFPDPEDAALIAGAIRAVREGKFASLDEALGLAAGRGQPPLSRRLAIFTRDLHLREAAELLAPAGSISGQAQRLLEAVDRYRSGRWQEDRLRSECPPHILGRVEGHLWQALRAHAYIPSLRGLQNILTKQDR